MMTNKGLIQTFLPKLMTPIACTTFGFTNFHLSSEGGVEFKGPSTATMNIRKTKASIESVEALDILDKFFTSEIGRTATSVLVVRTKNLPVIISLSVIKERTLVILSVMMIKYAHIPKISQRYRQNQD